MFDQTMSTAKAGALVLSAAEADRLEDTPDLRR